MRESLNQSTITAILKGTKMVKVVDFVEDDIHVINMKDGDIAIITKWGANHPYIGKIVLRNKNNLISLDIHDTFWDNISSLSNNCRVKILPKGTKLEVV